MKRLKLYIETSVWNFLFADDAPERRAITERFFRDEEIRKFDLYVSEIVLAEINDAPEPKRGLLLKKIGIYNPEILYLNKDVDAVAEEYLKNGLLTEKHIDDIYHLSYATVNGLDILLSWNMRHLVKRRTQLIVELTNKALGYRELEVWTPEELMEDDV